MGKYAQLKAYLLKQGHDYVPMTFREIEEIVGNKLPPSKQYPAWWSNNPSNNVMTKEWLGAGYQTESVNIGGEKLVFRRVRNAPPKTETLSGGSDDGGGGPAGAAAKTEVPRRSIFGCMKGTLTILPGVDLTEPADPELADWIDQKYGRE